VTNVAKLCAEHGLRYATVGINEHTAHRTEKPFELPRIFNEDEIDAIMLGAIFI